eukprot:TRINITY_DN4514_c0_g2_i1.p1 TRINITY_DN4514_c0_g2~~TRINITY_DN4514_c0_g2_i1.p1  ORF type:complete len:207 (+),score=52.06 TRINITY_DN4514_c0_g2_i1:64-684(+)
METNDKKIEDEDDLSDIEDDSDEEPQGEDQTPAKKTKWTTRTKQNLGSTAVGKALFNKFVGKETKQLIRAILAVVEKDKDKKVAKRLKSDIFKIAVKLIVLYEDKELTAVDFGKARGNFRRVCSAIRNGYRNGPLDEETATRISEHLRTFAAGIKDLISKLASPSLLARFDETTELLATTEFLLRTSKLKEYETVVYVLAYYLQET